MNSSELIFSERPQRIFQECLLLEQNDSYMQQLKCLSSRIIGTLVGYFIPVVSIPCITINLFIAIIVIINAKKASRQLIYISGICMSSGLANIIFTWLWQYPSYGLPYITNGAKFFSFLNISPEACRFHRFMYSFSATFMCNMRVCASVDRCLAIWKPLLLRKFRPHYAWYVYGAFIVISALLMLPFATEVNWIPSRYGLQCWVKFTDVYIQIHHAFLSNLGPIQTTLLIIIDITFAIKFRQQLKKHKSDKIDTTYSKLMRRYLLLFLSAITYNILAATQCTFLLLARLSSVGLIKFDSGLAYNISDILWYLNSFREILDFIIYHKCFHVFHIITSRLSKAFVNIKNSVSTSRSLSTTTVGSVNNY
ncbi:rhodopsin-like orphan GPCR [Schistosoma japonicum]|uniref:Rhodopsin-like orphan GPCR n=1 Tax=Schistosoma japonicum TaxID=6182 RepID=A0A4Z2CQX1_SCHJA|nr:rhodopsin-like orphan GPCR [Schistosoma japonicum]